MAAQSAIVLTDGQTTPVNWTFDPKGSRVTADKKEIATWRNQTNTQSVGWYTLTEQHTPVNQNGMEKFRFTLDVPTLESPSSGGAFVPPPTRAYGTIGVIEFWVHERATQAEIKNVVAMIKDLAAEAYLANTVEKREASW